MPLLLSDVDTVTIPEGELPLTPTITPGFAVAGVVLMISGVAYAMIGIKTRWLHCFFSVGFLGALGVTVLILYVMDPPVGNGVQGAYVVAVVGTGALLGGGSLIFQDVLECLGCLLGGFCLAMWLLPLKEGGLIGSGGAGNAIFVCVFSLAGLAGFFSRWTRAYFMIGCISLSGATATVIGIDCFSRAGLKEFWAWIWDVNENLFPLGADTYPLTRGIRVEQAATIIIFLCGIMSQSKVWKVIKERRDKREEERRRADAAHQEEEAVVGRKIEGHNAREMRDWDAVYGDPKSPMSVNTAHDSGMGDMDSVLEKRRRHSGTTTSGAGNDIEMAPMTPKTKTAAEMVMGKGQSDGAVTVQVAADEMDAAAAAEAEAYDVAARDLGFENGAQLMTHLAEAQLRATGGTPVPEVVPLPFKVPTVEHEDGRDDGDCSSIAAIPDGQYDDVPLERRRSVESKRQSFAKRLSTGSADLLRRLSHHSLSKQLEKTAQEGGESREDLTTPVHGDRDSVAATFDDASSAGGDFGAPSERPFSMEIKAELADKPTNEEAGVTKDAEETAAAEKTSGERRAAQATAPTNVSDPAATEAGPSQADGPTQLSEEHKGKQKAVGDDKESMPANTIVSEADTGPVSLTKDHLPSGLSKIALSYRTNEWAKHLSHAELPAPEELNIPEPVVPAATAAEEQAAPVHVRELQKTAENAAPPPAMPRSASAMAMARASYAQRPGSLTVPGNQVSARSPPHSPRPAVASPKGHLSPGPRAPPSANARWANAIAEDDGGHEEDGRQAAILAAAAALAGHAGRQTSPAPSTDSLGAVPAAGRPPIPGVVSYNSPQTLIGKRDHIMRVKNQALRPDSFRGSLGPGSEAGLPHHATPAGSRSSSRRNSGAYARGSPSDDANLDDDLPLSQRRTIIRERRSSMASAASTAAAPCGPGGPSSSSRRSSFGHPAPEAVATRRSELPSQGRRESQLAGFRASVQADLRKAAAGGPGGTPGVARPSAQPGFGGGYHSNNGTPVAGPLINSVYGIPGTSSGHVLPPHQTHVDSEVQRDIDAQRQVMMGQKTADARRRESRRADREKDERAFETRMRTDSQLMEAHREAMRRMQRKAT